MKLQKLKENVSEDEKHQQAGEKNMNDPVLPARVTEGIFTPSG